MNYKKLKYISYSYENGKIYNVVYRVFGDEPKSSENYVSFSDDYHLVRINDIFISWVQKYDINLDEMSEEDEEVFLFESILGHGKIL